MLSHQFAASAVTRLSHVNNMSEELPAYKYETLKPAGHDDGEIRLLTFLPGSSGSHISCKLHRVSLTQPPKYEAVSYTWGNPKGVWSTIQVAGDPSSTHKITLDGLRATVTYNLEAAFQQLRYVEAERILCVDALCIDQSSESERSEQVKVMGKIYERAGGIIAWLGEHDASVSLVFDTSEQLLWATNVLIYQGCADWNGLSIANITQEMLGLYIESNYPTPRSSSTLKIIRKSQQIANRTLGRSGLGAKISRPTKLTKSRSFSANTRRLVDLLASIPIVFPAEPISLTKMAVDAWENTDSFAEAIIKPMQLFSNTRFPGKNQCTPRSALHAELLKQAVGFARARIGI